MPTDLRITSPQRRVHRRFDAVLIVATRCLACAAIALATLLFIELQIWSWQFPAPELALSPELGAQTASP